MTQLAIIAWCLSRATKTQMRVTTHTSISRIAINRFYQIQINPESNLMGQLISASTKVQTTIFRLKMIKIFCLVTLIQVWMAKTAKLCLLMKSTTMLQMHFGTTNSIPIEAHWYPSKPLNPSNQAKECAHNLSSLAVYQSRRKKLRPCNPVNKPRVQATNQLTRTTQLWRSTHWTSNWARIFRIRDW